MPERKFNVLFLCTANSARSILAEAILSKTGKDHFNAYSAGSQPRGQINPHAIDLLRGLGHDISGLRSKSWAEFAEPNSPDMDFIFTVCDNAAGEACPLWPGKPMTAHWGLPDPADVQGTPAEIAAAFVTTYRMLAHRIELFLALPLHKLDRMTVHEKIKEIGAGATEHATAR